jgi:signal transduction histidine kinase
MRSSWHAISNLWFIAFLSLVLLAIGVVALYRRRVRQLLRECENKVNERTRRIRELYDSLLQSLQGLILRIQGVRNLVPGRSNKIAIALDEVLDLGDKAVVEARDAIHRDRPSPVDEDP